jgi:hypothetical protein
MKVKQQNPLQRDGTSQDQRFLDALEPSFAKVHELSMRDWLVFAFNYASRVNYFDTTDDKHAAGDWKAFFKEESEINEFLKDMETRSDYEPHLALFLCFLRLLQFSQDHLNRFSERHLDFYYKKVLQLKERPATSDKVHMIFELAKNATEQFIPYGSILDAGKDETGKPVYYQSSEEISINTAAISSLRTVYHNLKGYDPEKVTEGNPVKSIRYASVINSKDGMGTPFKKDYSPYYNAFGDDGLVVTRLGFALASSILSLREGLRKIQVDLDIEYSGSSTPLNYGLAKLGESIQIFLTSEKGWIKPDPDSIVISESSTDPELHFLTLRISSTVSATQKAIVNYNAKIHGEKYTTDLPVMRILFEAEETTGYLPLTILSKSVLRKATIKVDVSNVKDLLLENDSGKINPSKPFMPFTALPVIGSNFYIGSNEIFKKRWTSVTVKIAWKGIPEENMAEYYSAYNQVFEPPLAPALAIIPEAVTGNDYFTAHVDLISKGNKLVDKDYPFLPIINTDTISLAITPVGSDTGRVPFQSYELNILPGSRLSSEKTIIQNYLEAKPYVSSVFEMVNFNPGFNDPLAATKEPAGMTKEDYLHFALNQDFRHKLFASLYASVFIAKSGTIPNEPYTPVIESISLDYSASVTNDFVFTEIVGQKQLFQKNKLDDYSERKIQFFHEQPFGQTQQHPFLKDQAKFLNDSMIYLSPSYPMEGELYIGLDKVVPLSILNILFQVAEGSENPLTETFSPEQKIQWYCLCNNEWKPLNADYLVGDTTNNFLRSGIVKLLIPEEINTGNTLFGSGQYWLKAALPEGIHFDAVCKFIDIRTQALLSEFSPGRSGNHSSGSALPAGTIAKMPNKPAGIKSVLQPYNSFDGRNAESGQVFYRRVSERLRHKNRAVTIWDYERLILEKFPSVYKVRCLNHTSTDCEIAPGNVTVIVIPYTSNKNSYNPLQPRVSQNLLSEIETWLRGLNSMHVNFDADNPKYETVRVKLKVKFHDQYDPNHYKKQLDQDIIKYLSPWAFDEKSDIRFGGTIYKSVLIRYIEELEYVDFISDFNMFLNENYKNDKPSITCTDARAILVSHKNHMIDLMTNEDLCQ